MTVSTAGDACAGRRRHRALPPHARVPAAWLVFLLLSALQVSAHRAPALLPSSCGHELKLARANHQQPMHQWTPRVWIWRRGLGL
jgi:hypothetical protein